MEDDDLAQVRFLILQSKIEDGEVEEASRRRGARKLAGGKEGKRDAERMEADGYQIRAARLEQLKAQQGGSGGGGVSSGGTSGAQGGGGADKQQQEGTSLSFYIYTHTYIS